MLARHLKRYLAEFDFRYNERAALGSMTRLALIVSLVVSSESD